MAERYSAAKRLGREGTAGEELAGGGGSRFLGSGCDQMHFVHLQEEEQPPVE